MTRDPVGFAGGVNLYGYCGGNPVGRVDPSGLMLIAGIAALHGNNAAGAYAEFYLRYGADGEFQKGGISYNAATRYNKTGPRGLNGGRIEVVATGTRREMMNLEDAFIRDYAGYVNCEKIACAGLRSGQDSFLEQLEKFTGRSSGSGGALGSVGTVIGGADALMQGAGVIIPYRRRLHSLTQRVMNDEDDPPGAFGEDPD